MPARKPSESKVLNGTFQQYREPQQTPRYAEADLSAPASLDGDALVSWDFYAPRLARSGVLRETDRDSLEQYCLAVKNAREAQKLIDELGIVIYNDRGDPKKNPACTAWKEASDQMRFFSAKLGLDPASRGALEVGGRGSKGNPFTEL